METGGLGSIQDKVVELILADSPLSYSPLHDLFHRRGEVVDCVLRRLVFGLTVHLS